MQAHPGWVLWCKALDGMVRSRRQSDFATRIDGLDKAFEIATARGEVVGLMLAKALPDIMLSDVQADLEKVLASMREEGQENE